MEFPERESDVLALAWRMVEWLERNPELAAGAPVSADALRAAIDAAARASAQSAEADAKLRATFAAKDDGVARLKEVLTAHLQYVDMDVGGRPERLSGLGWGGRPGATDREPPGEVREVAVTLQSDGSVVLEWRPPSDGGPAAEYRIQRRKPGGRWEWVATALDNDCCVSGQPRGVDFDLRVVAVNKAGAGPPSAVVTVVL